MRSSGKVVKVSLAMNWRRDKNELGCYAMHGGAESVYGTSMKSANSTGSARS